MKVPDGFMHSTWSSKDRGDGKIRCHEYTRADGDQIDVWVGGRVCIHGDFSLDEIIAVLQHAKTVIEVPYG